MTLSRMIATVMGVGLLRPAPGTWGSLIAIPFAWATYVIGGMWLFLLAIPIGFAKGVWATTQETREAQDPDPSEIVVDEVVGQWIALAPVAIGAARTGVGFADLWPGILAAFVLFRLFDIWKPGPVGWADRLHTPLGVMLDDVIAGIMAAIGVVVLAAVAHQWLM